MMEHGLVDSSSYRPRSSLSEDSSLEESASGVEEFVSVSVTDLDNAPLQVEGSGRPATENQPPGHGTEGDKRLLKPPSGASPESGDSDWETLDPSVLEEGGTKEAAEEAHTDAAFDSNPETPITVQPQAVSGQGPLVQGLVSGLEEDPYGLPLPIFTKVKLSSPLKRSAVGALMGPFIFSRSRCFESSIELHQSADLQEPIRTETDQDTSY